MQRREKLVTKSFSTFDLQDAIETRESLFMESPSPAAKRKVDPLVVNFENLINESD